MFNECPPPQPRDIAINVPKGGLHNLIDILAAHHNYWQQQLQKAETKVDLGRHAISKAFYDDLHRSTTVYYAIDQGKLHENDFIKEGARRTALGTLALSILFRRLWPNGEEIQDMLGEKKLIAYSMPT